MTKLFSGVTNKCKDYNTAITSEAEAKVLSKKNYADILYATIDEANKIFITPPMVYHTIPMLFQDNDELPSHIF